MAAPTRALPPDLRKPGAGQGDLVALRLKGQWAPRRAPDRSDVAVGPAGVNLVARPATKPPTWAA